MLNPRRVLTHDLIYDRVWGYDFGPTSNALRVYVGYLRRKLQEAGCPAADPHRAGRRLRAARAMSLRTRIAAAAGLAVAVTVICAAAVVYLGVRVGAARRGRALAERPRDAIARFGPGGPGARPPGGPGQGHPAAIRPGRDFERRLQSRSPFGGAQGYAQFVQPDGTVLRPPGDPARLPVEERAREIAREGSGRYFSRHGGRRHAPARAHPGRRDRAGRYRWRGRSRRSTASSTASS